MSDLAVHGLAPASDMAPVLARAARSIPLRGRGGRIRAYAVVDAEDYAEVSRHRWYLKGEYVSRNIPKEGGGQQGLPLHRFLLGLEPGDPRKVDHINHDPLDNRRCNIRICTHQQNHQNRRRTGDRDTSSRYRGVSYNRQKQRWHAYGCLGGQIHHLGFFTDEQEAADAAAAWRELHMPFTTN